MAFIDLDIEPAAPGRRGGWVNLDAPDSGLRRITDVGVDIAKGAVGLGESVVGLVDLISFGAAGEGLAAIGYDPKRANEMLSDLYSNQRRRAEDKVQGAEGFLDTAYELVANPSTLLGRVAEAVPGTMSIAGLGRAVAIRTFSTAKTAALSAGLGEAAAKEAGIAAVQKALPKILTTVSATEGAQAAGSIAETARQEGREWADYVMPAVAAGVGTAVIGRASGAIAPKIGLGGDMETSIATAGMGAGAAQTGGVVKSALRGAAREGVLEEMPQSYQEQIFQNLATGKPATEGASAAAATGLLVGGAMGGAHAGITREEAPAPRARTLDEQLATLSQAKTPDEAIRAALEPLHESDVEDSVLSQGIISGAMGGAVDSAARAAREEPAYQDLEARKQADLGRMEAERTQRLGAIDTEQARLASGEQESIARDRLATQVAQGSGEGAMALAMRRAAGLPEETPAAVTDARGKMVLERMEALKRGEQVAGPDLTIDERAHEAAPSPRNELPEPTDAQKDAGNYKLGHARIGGMDVSIENPEGSERTGVSKDGTAWSTTMRSHYGYVRGTVGFDKDHVDVFVKPGTQPDWHGTVYVVNQNKDSGSFDEHKAMIGYATEADARTAYLANYSKGWEKNIRSITPAPLNFFKQWAADKTTMGPKGGALGAITILGKPVEQMTPAALQLAARSAGSAKQRAIAAAELERRAAPAPKELAPVFKKPAADAGGAKHALDFKGAFEGSGRGISDNLYAQIFNALKAGHERVAGVRDPILVRAEPAYKAGHIKTAADIRRFEETGYPPVTNKEAQTNVVLPAQEAKTETPPAAGAVPAAALEKPEQVKPPAPQPSTAALSNAPSKEGVGQGDVAPPASLESKKDTRDVVQWWDKELTASGREQALKAAGISLPNSVRYLHMKPEAQDAVRALFGTDKDPIVAEKKARPQFGEKNKVFTAEAAARAREILRKKLSGQVNTGLDPEVIQAGIQLAGYYIEGGARSFSVYSQRMIADLGQAVKPYLKSWYLAVRNYPGFDNKGMQSEAQLEEQETAKPTEKRTMMENAPPGGWTDADKVPPKKPATPQVDALPGMTPLGAKPAEAAKPVEQPQAPAPTAGGMTLTETRHTKTGQKLWVVKLGARVERSEFERHKGLAKRLGGNWSNFTKGFNFTEEAKAREFAGEKAPAPAALQKAASPADAIAKALRTAASDIEAAAGAAPKAPGEVYTGDANETPRVRPQESDRSGPAALAGVPAGEVQGPERGGNAGGGTEGGRRADDRGNGRPSDSGLSAPRGVGGNEGTVPHPAGGTGGGRADAGQPGVRRDRGPEQGPPAAGPGVTPAGAPLPGAVNFTITDALDLGKGGVVAKYNTNVAAIKLLKQLEAESRYATADEQAVLARYVGWGGIKQAFPIPGKPAAKGWEARAAEIGTLLTQEEWEAAARSIQDAHYTSKAVVDGMWKIAQRLGFDGGRVLESSMGVGNFFGLMPGALRQASTLTGVELDSITARIAKKLYPHANVQGPVGFHDVRFPDGHFNLSIGNPPFGEQALYDASAKHLKGFSIHNFFFAKAIDKLAPGGIHIAVVSRYLMDAQATTAREYLAHRTELVGALRLPWTAFAENANTEVVTDIVILKKLPKEAWGTADKAWVFTTSIPDPLGGEPMRVNRYFAAHPEMVLGRMDRSGEMRFEGDITVQPNENQPLEEAIDAAAAKLPENVYERGKPQLEQAADAVAAAIPEELIAGYTVGQFFEDGGKLYQRTMTDDGSLRAVEINADTQFGEASTWGETRVERLRGMVGIRQAARELLKAEALDDSDQKLKVLRKRLNQRYDNFVEKYGYLNDQANERVFKADPDAPLLVALEDEYDMGVSKARARTLEIESRAPTAKKMPIFRQRVVRPQTRVEKADTPADGLALSISEKGVVNMPYIAQLTRSTEGEVIAALTTGDKPLVYIDPATNTYQMASDYLSGNVKRKYQEAVAAGLVQQSEHLKAIFPPDVKAGDLRARMGAPWVDRETYQGFIAHLLGESASSVVRYVKANGGFVVAIEGGDPVMRTTRWGTERRDAADLITRVLNSKDVTVWDTDSEGNRYVNVEATQAAADKAEEIRQEFEDWIFKDPEQRERLVAFYNEHFNTNVKGEIDGAYLTLPGKVPDAVIKLRRHQLDAIARMIRRGKALLDHVVGAGKTYTIIGAIMEKRRLGLSKKPMVVVPNHLVEQWATDFYRLYPGARILAMRKADFAKVSRQRMLARVATGDWDAVIFSHSSFGFIENDRDVLKAALDAQVAEIQKAIELARETEGKKSRTAAQYQKSKEKIEQRLKALMDKPKDKVLTFQELGVDDLHLDESQEFKNLFFTTQRTGVGGFGNPTGSKKAFDMFIKTQWLLRTQQDRGVTFATGTPVSNSLTELYTLQRYLGMGELEARGLTSLDAWLNAFGIIQSEYESNVTGTKYKRKERLRRITNAPEVMQLYQDFADSVTLEDIKRNYREDNNGAEFPVPRVKSHPKSRENITVKPSPAQVEFSASLQTRMENLKRGGTDNALAILGDGRKAALDMRLVDPQAPDNPEGKTHRVADEIARLYKSTTERKGTQLVFLDLSTPLKHGASAAKKFLTQARKLLGDPKAAPFGSLTRQWHELRLRLIERMDTVEETDETAGVDAIEKFLEDAPEIEAAVTTSDNKFSVYDDMREKLIERGIPGNEIAFIHDYDGDTKKQELFDMVNAGRIRVLMGSTPKMGAGTNVQRKAVGLHHVDVPWRPSDIEQREGRVIRQGNEFRLADPDFAVEIYAYATEATSDVFFWQTQEQKLNGINSLRKFKGEREIEEVSADAMSAAEMKALASGNPLILEDVQLTEAIRKLEGQRRRHIAGQQDIESKARKYEQAIARLPKVIAEQDAVVAQVKAYAKDPFDGERPTVDVDGQAMDAKAALEHVDQVIAKVRDAAYSKDAPIREKLSAIEREASQHHKNTTAFKELDKQHSELSETLAINNLDWKVSIGGKEYKSRDGARIAIVKAAGDIAAIRMVVEGKDLIRRRDIEAAIQPIVDKMADDNEGDVTLGTFGTLPVRLRWFPERSKSIPAAVRVSIGPEMDGDVNQFIPMVDGKQIGEPQVRAEIVLRKAENLLFFAPSTLESNRDYLKRAEKGLAPLKAEIGKAWGKDAELNTKKGRLAAVQKELAGTEKKDSVTTDPNATRKLYEAVESVLTDEDKADAAAELGDEEWSDGTAKKFTAGYAEWLQRGAKNLGTKLGALFRKVLEAVRSGVLSIAVAFNFNATTYTTPVELPATGRTVRQAIERPKADFQGVIPSAEAKVVADWFVRNDMHGEQPFIVADKPNGFLYAFDQSGTLLAKSPAIFGKARGDTLTEAQASKAVDETTDTDKVTPAGVFTAKRGSYGGSTSLVMKEYEQSNISLHRVYLGTPSEQRLERIVSANPDDKRISYGCINALPEFIDEVVEPHFDAGSQIVVIPETMDAATYFGINDPTVEIVETTETVPGGTTQKVAWGEEKYGREERAGRRRRSPGRFSRAGTERGGVHLDDLRALAKSIKMAYPIHPAMSVSEWPADLRELVDKAAYSDTIDAAFFEGEIWLAGDRIADVDAAQHRILHEGTHGGLRGLFGDELRPMMLRIHQSNANVRARVAEMRAGMPKLPLVEATEEVLVNMGAAGEAKNLNGWDRFVAWVKDWLRRHGFTPGFVQAFTDEDVLHILQRAGEVAQGDRVGTAQYSGYAAFSAEPKFDRSSRYERAARVENADALEAWLGKQAKRAGFKNVDEFARKDPATLERLAADWRVEHPADAMFHRVAIAGGPTVGDHRDRLAATASRFARDLLHNDKRFNWWHRTIGTQQHKALTNREFRPVYDESQAFLADVNKYANEAADNAQSLLPRIESFADFFKKSASKEDIDAATKALYAGTLWGGGSPLQGRKWNDAELRSGRALQNMGGGQLVVFPALNDRQIELYRQARASVDKSLDELGKSLIHRLVRQHGLGFDRGMGLEDVAQDVRDQIDEAISEKQLELDYATSQGDGGATDKVQAAIEQLHSLQAQVSDIEQKTTTLKDRGYFPAMRFGKYAVHVVREDAGGEPEQLFFGLYESQTAANLAVREIQRDPEFDGATITRGIISKEQNRLFQGLSLDALEAFADYITGEDGQPIAKDPLVQGFLKAAVAERSSLKRHIHRKGLAGYSDDLPRVLASFTVSSARTTSGNYHNAEMLRLAQDIRAGDVKDEAIKLVRYLLDPVEEAQAIRGFLFAQFLGGSIAHGLVNMTQPFMVTIPWLAQHTGAGDAAAKVAAAAKTRPEKLTGRIADAYARAKKEGVVAPQEIHQLRAETGGLPLAKNLALRKLSFLWGSIYAITEQFNRSTAFIAAYRVAEAKRMPDPYAFAVAAVNETQFVYNKGNRPNWARGPVGATVFTFKQFSISYLELAKRLYGKDKKAFALMALMLLAGAGAEGLPFAEDLEDLVDTIGQWMGYATNSKKALRKWATNLLGPDLAQVALHGISGLPWMPVDVSVRLGLQNLIPGTAMLKLSEKNKAQDVLDLAGPIGQFVPAEGTMMGRALERISKGDWYGAVKSAAPVAVQNLAKGSEMLSTGEARDAKGKKITDVSAGEAVFKMAGLQPAKVARESRRMSEVTQDIDLQRRTEDEIAEQWARGIVDKKPEDVRAAMKKLHDWNQDNPELRVRVNMDQIRRRVKNMRTPRDERLAKSAPPEIRAGVREALRE